ncbi:MAG: hypothetical protein ABW182_04925 [Sphingomonas sp.]
MSRTGFTVTAILRATVGLVAARPAPAAIAILGMVGAGIVIDLAVTDTELYNVAIAFLSIAGLVAQFALLDAVMRQEGLIGRDHGGSRSGSFIILSILTGSAILIGTLLLIIPGLLLAARWAVAAPMVIADRMNWRDAMAASEQQTRLDRVSLALVWALVGIPTVVAVVLAVALYPESGTPEPAPAILANLMLYFGQVIGWYASIAIYASYQRDEPSLREVFA